MGEQINVVPLQVVKTLESNQKTAEARIERSILMNADPANLHVLDLIAARFNADGEYPIQSRKLKDLAYVHEVAQFRRERSPLT